jgi:hypothetical protein
MRGRAQEIEQRRIGWVIADEADGAFAHSDIERLLKAERVVICANCYPTGPTDIDDRRLASFEKSLGTRFCDMVDHEVLVCRHDAADDHPVEMAVGEIDLPFGRKSFLDHEAIAQALRVAPCRVRRSYDLAYDTEIVTASASRHEEWGQVSTTYSVSWLIVVSALSTSKTLVPWLMITKRSQTW